MGGPPGEDPRFYRDVLLGLIFVPISVFALLLALEKQFVPSFWILLAIAATALVAATKRSILIAGLLGFTGIRFLVAGVARLDFVAVAIGLVFSVIAWIVVSRDPAGY